MERANRRHKEQVKYMKRLKVFAAKTDGVIIDGHINPLPTDLKSWRAGKVFKTTGKPCSCYACSPNKYSRKQKHKNDQDSSSL